MSWGKQARDPLDQIEAMLASICKTSDRPHISDAGGNQKGSEYIPNFEIVSRPENMESQQASRATSEEDVKWKFDTKASPPKSNLSKKKRVARQKHHKAMPSGVNKKNTAKTTRAGKKPKQQKNSQSRGAKVSSAKDNLLPPPRECHVINLEKQLDMFGTSSDERENRNFVEHMKQMAEEKICADKKKTEALTARVMNNMKQLAGKHEERMREIAGGVSKEISKSITRQRKCMTRNMCEEVKDIENMLCSVPKDGKALECIVKEFKKEKESCEMQLTSRRKESERLQENKEKKLLNSIGEIAAKSREFNKLVMQIDKVLKG